MRRREWTRRSAPALLSGLLLALLSASGLTGARAQSGYPDKPVRIVVDSAVGSANDVTARTIADQLGKIWNQQVVILNQPGAGGAISAAAARAE